jgi:hypothetical protein
MKKKLIKNCRKSSPEIVFFMQILPTPQKWYFALFLPQEQNPSVMNRCFILVMICCKLESKTTVHYTISTGLKLPFSQVSF